MLNWDEVRHQSQSAYKTDARAVQQKKQTKADSPSSIDWNRVYYTPNILKFQESERAVAAKRSKLAQDWGTGISSLNNETTAPTQTAPFKKGTSLSEQLTVQNALNTINSPALTASDMAKQMQAANTLADMGYVKKPEPKPTLLQTIGNIISDPLGSVVRGAEKIDEALAKSDNVFARNIAAGLGDVSSNLLNSIPGGYDSQSGPAIQIREDAAKAQARGDNTVLGQVIRSIPQTAGALYTSVATGGGKVLPFLWSLGQSYGGAYGQARDEGVDHKQARNAALLQGIPQAAIEVLGGVENLIGKSAGKGLLRTIGRAALEEGLEEVAQYPFEGLAKKLTYAPETPITSLNEQAILNPVEMGKNALVGGIAGGLFGGATGIATQGINLSGSNNISNILSQESVKPGGAGPAIQTQPTAQAQQTQPTTQNQQAQQQAAKMPLTQVEINTVKNTPELRALPEAKQYLMLEAPKMRTPDVIEALPPKPATGTLAEVTTEPIHPRFPNTTFSSEPNKLYREVGPDRLLAYVDSIAYDAPYGAFPNELYVKKSPELALGQGTNRGIMLQFSDENVPLVRNTKKVFNPENGEYLVDAGTRDARDNMIPLRHNLEKVTINKDLLGDITQADLDLSKQYAINKAQLNRVTIPTFEARGWKKSFDVEGNLILTNPKLQKAKEIYETAEQNIIHTVPEQYRRETPFTVFRSSEPPKVQSQYAREVFTPIGGESARNVAKSADIPPIGGRIETPQGRIYGEQPKGEIPEGMRERGFSRNIRTDEAMPDDIRQMFDEEPLAYKQISNQATLAKAEKIMEQGEEAATAEFYRSIGAKEFKPETVPLAKMLAKQANEAGNVAKAREILSATAERLTEAGQFSQAAKILREADPETFLMTMDKQLKKLNEQGRKKYGKKWKDVDLTSEEIEAIKNIPKGDQQAYDGVWEQIGNRISKELHSSGIEKFNAWRRMAMLLNPKTHIRNVGGNVIMMGMRKAADTIGAALQKAFVPAGQRTQSVGWSFNKDIVAKVNENWDTVKKDILGESRWEIGNLKSLGREKRIFKNPALQWLNEVSLKSLNLEDNIFTERAYKDALGQYLQANNMTEVTSEAIEYAKRRALEATFKQANMLADFINKAKNVPVAGFFVEGAIPFTQTPANIIMRGIEYSPGGIIKALYDIKAGKTAATVIEDLSKGLTGSAILALGFWLSSIGWAKVNRKRSDKAEALYQELGDQRYAINTPLGSYTFDWAQPFSIPFAMGIAAQEAIRDRKDGDTIIQAVIDGIAAGGDTIFNMTMLQNIREILGSYGSPTEKIMGIPIDYLEQAIASVLGQTARTIDPVRRSTYDPNSIGQWWRGIRARIPGLSQTLEPALNIWGQEQSQGGALQQFISPGYFRARSDDPVTNEMARLYESVNDTSILPKTAPNSFTKDKVEYKLSAQQKTEFARIMGQKNYNDLARLFTSSKYKELTDEQRAKRVKSIVESNYDEAKGIIIGGAK